MKGLEVLEIIKDQNITNIEQLLALDLASESTIRRILNELQSIGFINLRFGGYIDIVDNELVSVADSFKKNINVAQKRRLGKMCSELINDGDVIFIDNGTTVRFILEHVKDKNVIIYSNGYNHIEVAQKYDLDFRIIPGEVLYKEAAIIGEEAIAFLSYINFDIAFIGANGFEEKAGITTPNQNEAVFKRFALGNANKSYVVIDAKKYRLISKFKVCNFDEYPVITLPIT